MKILVSAILCLSLIGCAGVQTQRLSDDTMFSLDGKTVTLVRRESPSFVATTSGKGMFAVAGVGALELTAASGIRELARCPPLCSSAAAQCER